MYVIYFCPSGSHKRGGVDVGFAIPLIRHCQLVSSQRQVTDEMNRVLASCRDVMGSGAADDRAYLVAYVMTSRLAVAQRINNCRRRAAAEAIINRQ